MTLVEPLARPPAPPAREAVDCYLCGSPRKSLLTHAVDDLGGRPGRFTFHTCDDCGFAYQDPRVPASEIGAWYDDAYIAHRRNADFGLLTPLYRWVMGKHDRAKQRLVGRFVRLDDATRVLDVGCAAGTFLALLRARSGCRGTGVDFKDLSDAPAFQHVDFVRGSFAEVDLPAASFDLVTLWHYLEHDYDPPAALARCRALLAREGRLVIEVPCLDSRTARWYGARWPGLQAPQHTVLFSQEHLQRAVRAANLEVVAHLPYGAFPPWFYVYAGWRFRRLAGRGFVPRDELLGYLLGQALCAPWLACAGRRNLAMQTVVCRRTA